VERPPVRKERIDAGVAVADAGKGGEAHQLDELLVRVEPVDPRREPVGCRLPVVRPDVVEQVRMKPLELPGEH
jgi:hypothetical protein